MASSPGRTKLSTVDKKQGHKFQDERTYARELFESQLVIHKPQSADDRLAFLVIETLVREQVEDCCYRLVPQVLYSDPLVGACFKPNCLASRYRSQRAGYDSLKPLYTAMNEALSALQLALSTPLSTNRSARSVCLLAVSGLSCFDSLKGDSGFGSAGHLDGMMAILGCAAGEPDFDDLGYALLDLHCVDFCIASCVRGQVSPVEAPLGRFTTAKTTSSTRDSTTSRLQAVSSDLFSMIPRLVLYLRKYRASALRPLGDLAKMQKLAHDLFHHGAEDAENTALHEVHITRVKLAVDEQISRHAMHYQSWDRFEALLRHWTSRLIVVTACLRIQKHSTSTPQTTEEEDSSHTLPSICDLQAESKRLTTQLLMSRTYARTVRSRRRGWAHALVTISGALADLPSDNDKEQKELTMSWIVQELTATLRPTTPFSQRDVDDAAELMVGAGSGGRYGEIYSRRPA
ncbi:hypothetical protein LTR62_001491 [Meristemomyces frigidus]|uniref:Uncharacterized protein n=1 Tax=Meristemomyces frigidus TaxID=1508187 RepID=A0AAN7THA3_9PEZI|nr:hypothetical protein LTR62_001491 [Meristemomyces frigidus]